MSVLDGGHQRLAQALDARRKVECQTVIFGLLPTDQPLTASSILFWAGDDGFDVQAFGYSTAPRVGEQPLLCTVVL